MEPPRRISRCLTKTGKSANWQKKMNYGKPTMGVVRTTYLIEKGTIVKAFGNVKAADNPAQMLQALG